MAAVRVLVVDPDIGFIVRLKQALEELEFTVRAVGRPKAALTAFEQAEFDVAVVDTRLETLGSLIQIIHELGIPVVLSIDKPTDADLPAQFGIEYAIDKPYIARDLIPLLKKATGPRPIIQRLQPRITEPPIEKDATIGDVIATFTEEEFYQVTEGAGEADETLPPDILPESAEYLATVLDYPEPPIREDDSPASTVLKMSNDASALDTILVNMQSWVNQIQRWHVRPLPSWQIPNTAEEIAKIEAVIGSLSQALQSAAEAEEPPFSAQTQPVYPLNIDIDREDTSDFTPPPQITQTLHPELVEALANAEDLEALAEVVQHHLFDVESLLPATVEEITQAMGVVIMDDDEPEPEPPAYAETLDTSPDAQAAEELIREIDLVAHAALQLTQFSLESIAKGTLLTQNDLTIARSGNFAPESWQVIIDAIQDAWEREGNPQTRLIYRDIEGIGNTLIFSTRTINNLMLNMIFSADTSLRIIRQQTARLMQALVAIPVHEIQETDSPEQEVEPEPLTSITQSNRPTGLKPPEGWTEAVEVVTEKPVRTKGTYMGYACLWLAEQPLAADWQEALGRWVDRAAIGHDWDVKAVEISEQWVNLHVEIPTQTNPGHVVHTLMQETIQSLSEALNKNPEAFEHLWAEGYSITTPGRLLAPHEIERFVAYYHG
ncbi:MAG: transposase [Anaerolineales bacterium]|nr:transposase [Anaerolineales bacterium]